uniref:Neutrophil cytosolic factor 2 n=1 Tax=Plecoglossus altivelis TaxID=61084 RepID=A2A240_PLEAT|nr:neutrophil cytosolic factor 2 [Plecoglossus altivelis]
MSFVDTLRQWDEAVALVNRGDLATALTVFLDIQDKNSKISFNIGCLHLINNDLAAAEKAFDSSIRKDEHLAIAFFQRGITFYKNGRFEESFADFQLAFKKLRGNQLIDYKPLGLRYKLYACEVLHNMALTHAHMGQWEKAQENLVSALNLRTEAKLSHIDKALESILKQKLFQLVEVPKNVLFRPNQNYVAELEKKDYLGKAKVVSSIVPEDEFSGFAPLQPQVEDAPVAPKAPEVLRALEGEPHTVLFEFVPETSDELAVVPGNIVFVLQRGTDNWASVIFNERRGLVPYNYLERLEINLSSKIDLNISDDQIPASPRRAAPSRPKREPASKAPENQDHPDSEVVVSRKDECIVKVHFTFTFTICVARGASYATLAEKIASKLKLPVTSITLSYSLMRTKKTINQDTKMEDVWSQVNNGHLTLWCTLQEDMNFQQQGHQLLLAVHSFESSNPEDLTFYKGDLIIQLGKVNDDWFEGQCKGKIGIFPSAFVTEAPVKSTQEE